MSLVNCEVNLTITCSANCFIVDNSIDNQIP